jgi:hypothetical protein
MLNFGAFVGRSDQGDPIDLSNPAEMTQPL